jgi:predicted DNA-binding protein (UPF0251 family)
VATNACLNHLRSRGRLGDDPAAIARAPAPVDDFERAQTVTLVEKALGALNERYRTALVLKDLHGLRAGEIAEAMTVSRPAADVLVHRARAAFRSAFVAAGGAPGATPASLGLALAPLSVPAALQSLPLLPTSPGAVPAPSGIDATPAALLPDPSTAIGHGGGLLAKLGAALATKAGATVAAATLVVGGGAAVLGGDAATVEWSRPSTPSSAVSMAQSQHEEHGSSAHDAHWRAAAHPEGHEWPNGGHHDAPGDLDDLSTAADEGDHDTTDDHLTSDAASSTTVTTVETPVTHDVDGDAPVTVDEHTDESPEVPIRH